MSELNRVEKWLDQALELENRGHDFYTRAARAAVGRPVRDFFQYLADQELAHLIIIKGLFDRLDDDSRWTSANDQPPPASLFSELFSKLTDSKLPPETGLLEAIDQGIAFETEARDIYARQLDQAGSEGELKFLRLMVGEENEHRRILSDLKLYYRDPVGWAEDLDHGHLDGA